MRIRNDSIDQIGIIREYLEEHNYMFIYDFYFSQVNLSKNIFVDFDRSSSLLKLLSPTYKFVFSLFHLGYPIETEFFHQFMPQKVFDALIKTGIISKNRDSLWQTNGLAIIPYQGLYFLNSIPQSYPTSHLGYPKFPFHANNKLVSGLIPNLKKDSVVLDLMSQNGILGMIAAKKMAKKSVILPVSEHSIDIVRFNVILNGLNERVDICSRPNQLSEQFDFIFSILPTLPDLWLDNQDSVHFMGGYNGEKLFPEAFEIIRNKLKPNGKWGMLIKTLGDEKGNISINERFLKSYAIKNKHTIKSSVIFKSLLSHEVDTYLEYTQTTWDRVAGLDLEKIKSQVNSWVHLLTSTEQPFEFVYTQLLEGHKNGNGKFYSHSIFDKVLDDPLMSRTYLSHQFN